MSRFTFVTDDKSEQFFLDTMQTMVRLFAIPGSEAIGRINRHFQGQTLVGSHHVIYHQDEEY